MTSNAFSASRLTGLGPALTDVMPRQPLGEALTVVWVPNAAEYAREQARTGYLDTCQMCRGTAVVTPVAVYADHSVCWWCVAEYDSALWRAYQAFANADQDLWHIADRRTDAALYEDARQSVLALMGASTLGGGPETPRMFASRTVARYALVGATAILTAAQETGM